jgi:Mn2+/Fe2+ NRAMP family transporter
MNRLWSTLFWSIIAAAFIGPGTVTTAASAGAGHGYALLWALGFSTLACLVLQEAAARLTVVSGNDLGRAIRSRHAEGWRRSAVLGLVLGAIVLGCAAYEAGNILGGAAGAMLGADLDPRAVTLICGIAAAVLLASGRTAIVTQVLALLVAVMGVTFLYTAWQLGPSLLQATQGLLLPTFPQGSSLLILGLVGTTVVPYNLFLGSGLARGQELSELRFGLTCAVLLGGLISMGVLVVGTAVVGKFGFDTLTQVLTLELGPGARKLFGLGLFAAGLSSAITAPLAAAVTARSLFAASPGDEAWSNRSWRFASVWAGVLLVGVVFGLAGVKPVPAILLAQALNGVLLPFVAVFLTMAVNDRALMGAQVNGRWANRLLLPVVAATLLLGVKGVVSAGAATFGLTAPGAVWTLAAAVVVVVVLRRPLLGTLRSMQL